jgi:hypothetical protein
MIAAAARTAHHERPRPMWRWPIDLSAYDRRPRLLRREAAALTAPIVDACDHFDIRTRRLRCTIQHVLTLEMHRRRSTYWAWSEDTWHAIVGTSRVQFETMADHPAWQLPLGYKDGVYGAERVPSVAYLGDRDMFLFLVDGNRNLDDPTDRSHAGMFRGFILRNSDVGAAALTLDLFLSRAVCANHVRLIWGFTHVAGFRRRHVGASIHEAWTESLQSVRDALDASLDDDRATLLRVVAPATACQVNTEYSYELRIVVRCGARVKASRWDK